MKVKGNLELNETFECKLELKMGLYIASKNENGKGVSPTIFEDGFQINSLSDEQKLHLNNKIIKKELEFMSKISFNTIQTTRMNYINYFLLNKLNYNNECIIFEAYLTIKTKYNEYINDTESKDVYKHFNATLDDVKFGFLLYYICEMSYFDPVLLSYNKYKLSTSIIICGYIILWKHNNTFNIVNYIFLCFIFKLNYIYIYINTYITAI